MQLSNYLKAWPYPDKPGYHLLYSTKKASVALLPSAGFDKISNNAGATEYTENLTKLGMLIPDRQQERVDVLGFANEINRLNTGLVVSVILGLDCNFACTYCYEGSMKGKHAMADDTADQFIAYIKSRFTPDKKKLILDFYGGEPLLYTKRIKYIARQLKPYVEERGGIFRFSLVTNGSLLTKKITKELIPLGLSIAKLTVDGPAAIHDQYRPFKSGRPSFDTIMANAQDCCEVVKIGLGGNFSADNYPDFPALFDAMADYNLSPEKLGPVQFFPVIQTRDQYANPEFSGGCMTCNEAWVIEATLRLREEVLKRGYKTPKIGLSPCMVDIDDAFVVHYDGSIFKCVALIGHPQFAIGDVWKGTGDFREIYGLDSWRENVECRKCVYLPLCFGGCRYMEYQRTGSMTEVDCMRGYLDATLEKMLFQDVRYRYRSA
jgi:uncharacterized protein